MTSRVCKWGDYLSTCIRGWAVGITQVMCVEVYVEWMLVLQAWL